MTFPLFVDAILPSLVIPGQKCFISYKCVLYDPFNRGKRIASSVRRVNLCVWACLEYIQWCILGSLSRAGWGELCFSPVPLHPTRVVECVLLSEEVKSCVRVYACACVRVCHVHSAD